jgi:Fe2+ transport system protein FeoA
VPEENMNPMNATANDLLETAPTNCQRPLTCSLNRVRAGMTVRIKALSAPADVSQRLREIGFCEQQVIRLLTSQSNLICQVCNARLALSSQLAQLIMVEPVF